jgi:sarcosine oxidase subunit alpha
LRIEKHPILDFKFDKKIRFYFNNKLMYGFQGDSIASAIYAQGVKKFSTSQKYKRPRGFFCAIGKCSSCLMRVNGIPNVRTCIAPLKENIFVETQNDFPRLPSAEFIGEPKKKINTDILVIGAGPAGSCAAIQAANENAKVLIVDENQFIGGQLVKQTHKFFGSKDEKAGTRGINIAKELEKEIFDLQKKGKIDLMLNSTVIGYYEKDKKNFHKFGVVERKNYESILYEVNCKAAVFACGAMENMLLFPGNDLPGVYGAGAVQTLMNVYGVKPGEKVLMVGAGNVGLIVSYQLLQAGICVDRVVEAAPKIGGYHVHSAKLRRCGVPIFTSCTIKEVNGNGRVDEVVTVKLNDKWEPIKGTEEKIKCDTVCLAVGLTPSTRLLFQTGVDMSFIPEAGGYIALHDDFMQTSVKGLFVSGDASSIEEASTAMIEGKIAGLAASVLLGYDKNKNLLKKYKKELEALRAGPFGEKPRIANEKIIKLMRKKNA